MAEVREVKIGLVDASKFNISKRKFNQLMWVYKFMKQNPDMEIEEVRARLKEKPFEFGFVLKCDRKIENFFSELKAHGVVQMIEMLSRQKDIENFANKNL